MSSAPEAYHKAFAAARQLRELARDAHGNLAALQVARLPEDAAMAAELASVTVELVALGGRLAAIRERTAALAEAHVEGNRDRLRAGFGYVIRGGHAVTKATTPPGGG